MTVAKYLLQGRIAHDALIPQLYMDLDNLVERAKAKDPQAFDTLYKMYFRKMMGVCLKIIKGDEETAKDLVHDAFVLAFISLGELRDNRKFGEWLTTIVRNVSYKNVGKKSGIHLVPLTSVSGEDQLAAPAAFSSESAVDSRELQELISRLPEGYGTVFRLSVIEGFSHKEIAGMLGIEPHSSSSQLTRAKALLRKMLDRKLWFIGILFVLVIPVYVYLSRQRPAKKDKLPLAEKKHADETPKENPSGWVAHSTTVAQHDNVHSRQGRVMQVVSVDSLYVPDSIETDVDVPDKMMATEIPCDTAGNSPCDTVVVRPTGRPDILLAQKTTLRKNGRWKIAATGTLGMALAQNTGKQFLAGHILDTGLDGPPSIIPGQVGTWEEYSGYLHLLQHENTPADTLVLMEIADRNHGDIIEKEQHDRPITFGISLSRAIRNKWSVETGLQYSLLNSKFTTGEGGFFIGRNQSVHYLSLPVRVSYKFAEYKRLSAYAAAGAALHIPVYGKSDSYYVTESTAIHIDRWRIKPPVQWSTNVGLGLQYRFMPKVSVYFEPTLNWYIPSGSSTHTIWTERPFVFSAPFGIRISW